MVPIYAIASSLSFVFYHEALYFQLGRDCYEALIIASFFNLLLAYLSSPTTTEDLADDDTTLPYLQSTTSLPTALQKPRRKSRKAQENDRKAKLRDVMRDVKVGKWIWPFGWVKWRPAKGGRGEGSTFLWLMRLGIMQYTILRPLTTLVRRSLPSLECRDSRQRTDDSSSRSPSWRILSTCTVSLPGRLHSFISSQSLFVSFSDSRC